MTTALIANPVVISDADLAAITSYEDAFALLKGLGVQVEKATDYGTGFAVIDKAKLIGVDFLILSWDFHTGSYVGSDGNNGQFVAAEIVTKHGDKGVIVDGGTGILAQLKMVTDQRIDNAHPQPQAGLLVENGLTVSTYYRNKDTGAITKTQEKGSEPGTTYYLAS